MPWLERQCRKQKLSVCFANPLIKWALSCSQNELLSIQYASVSWYPCTVALQSCASLLISMHHLPPTAFREQQETLLSSQKKPKQRIPAEFSTREMVSVFSHSDLPKGTAGICMDWPLVTSHQSCQDENTITCRLTDIVCNHLATLPHKTFMTNRHDNRNEPYIAVK